jgi:hypothetical protein
VTRLNSQWLNGKPSNTLGETGVLVRQFDKLDDSYNVKPWMPCPQDQWCAKYGDRWATSVVNKDLRHLYFHAEGGLVLSKSLRVLCVHQNDGNSMAEERTCPTLYGDGKTCIPGCYPKGQECADVHRDWLCSFPPDRMQEAIAAQLARGGNHHNEFVIDTRSVLERLPHAVEAFFYMPDSIVETEEWTRFTHKAFLAEYKLSADAVPLLRFDPNGGRDGRTPFVLMRVRD